MRLDSIKNAAVIEFFKVSGNDGKPIAYTTTDSLGSSAPSGNGVRTLTQGGM